MSKANITDSNGNDVYFGDEFIAQMVVPSVWPGTRVKVVEDVKSKEEGTIS